MTTPGSTSRAFRLDFRRLAEMLGLAALYFLTARLGLLLAIPDGHVTPVWPPSGIALAAVLLLGQRVVPGIWLGSFAANLWDFYGDSRGMATALGTSAVFGLGATVTAWAGGRLLRWVVDGRNPLERVRDVCALLALGGMGSCLISATIGVTTLCFTGHVPWSGYEQTWLTWWLGDTAGVFVVTPLFLVWNGTRWLKSAARWAELVACFGLLLAVTCFVFIGNTAAQPFAFLPIPFLVWSAVRFGRRGAAVATGLLAVLAVWGTLHQSGPFHLGGRTESLMVLELYLGVVVLTALCAAALITERDHAAAAQLRAMDGLESRVRERTAALAQSEAEARRHLAEAECSRGALLSILEDELLTKAALRERERELRLIANQSPGPVSRVNRELRYLFANDRYEMDFGRPLARIIGHTMPEVLGEELFQQVKPHIDRVLAGEPVVFENPLRTAAGDVKFFQVNYVPDLDLEKRVIGFFVFALDITERKKTEQARDHSLSLTRATLESTADGILVVSSEGKIETFNQIFVRMWQLPDEVLAAKDDARALQCVLDQLREPHKFLEKVSHLYAHPMEESFDTLAFTDGRVFERYSQPQLIGGRAVGRVWSFRDITEHRRAEQRLAAFATLGRRLNAAPDAAVAARIIVGVADELFGWDSCKLNLYEAQTDRCQSILTMDILDGRRQEVAPVQATEPPSPRMRQVIQHGPLLVLREEPLAEMNEQDYAPFGDVNRPSAAIMAVPVLEGRKVIGMLTIQSYRRHAYTPADLNALQDLADHCAGALARLRGRDALRASEANYRTLIESASDGILVTEASGRLLDVNAAGCRMFGHTREALLTLRLADIIAGDEAQRVMPEMAHLSRGELVLSEWQGRRGDGTIFPCEVSATVLPDGRMLGILRDVSERKQAEAALRESEERYRRIVQTAEEGIWMIDAQARTSFVNPKLAQMLAYTVEEMRGRSIDDFMEEGARRLAAESLQRRQQGIAEQHDFKFLRKDGSELWAWLSTNPIFAADGTYAGTLAMVTDITARKRTEAILQRTEQLYRRVIAGADAVPYDYDYPTRQYHFIGEGIERLTGYRPEEIAGPLWERIIQESVMLGEAAGLSKEEAARRVLRGEIQQWRSDMRIRTRAGKTRWLADVSVQKHDAAGRVTGSMGILQDITERKLAEQQLRESREQLRALLARLQRAQEAERIQVSREIHDELGQLLTGLKMDVRWMEKKLADPGLPPRLHPLLDRAVAASELADQTIAVVQKIAAELRPGALDRLGLGAALTQRARRFQERTGVRCRVALAESGPALPAELITELYYICQEALTNVARHAQATEVQISFEADDTRILLRVDDDGKGIAPADFNAPQSLGLLGMRERALNCGGTIAWEPGEPQGTRVTVRVPRPGTRATEETQS